MDTVTEISRLIDLLQFLKSKGVHSVSVNGNEIGSIAAIGSNVDFADASYELNGMVDTKDLGDVIFYTREW